MKITQEDIDSEFLAKTAKEHFSHSPLKTYLKNIAIEVETGKSPIPKGDQAAFIAAANGLLNAMNKGKK